MLGLLNAYRHEKNAPQYQIEYGEMCMEFLRQAFPGRKVKMYGAGLGELPTGVDECEAYIITGSPKSAYDDDAWVKSLGEFVRECHQAEKKMIGICFGHQLIAHYLGGRTEKAKNGWGVGVRSFRMLVSKPWMKPELREVSLLFSHQDQVVSLPPGAELLAQDEFCENQMFSIKEHILCLQGHPEFTTSFAKDRLDTRIEKVGQEKYERAVKSMAQETHSRELGQWMQRFVEGASEARS